VSSTCCWPPPGRLPVPACACSSLARTHLFFPLFGEVNGKTGTPIYATLFVLIATLPLAILTDLPPLIDMVSAGECLSYRVLRAADTCLHESHDKAPSSGKAH
jgi:hypothetical protein